MKRLGFIFFSFCLVSHSLKGVCISDLENIVQALNFSQDVLMKSVQMDLANQEFEYVSNSDFMQIGDAIANCDLEWDQLTHLQKPAIPFQLIADQSEESSLGWVKHFASLENEKLESSTEGGPFSLGVESKQTAKSGWVSLELQGAAFRPTSSVIRKIYHDYIGLYNLETTFQISTHFISQVSLGYLLTKGYSLGIKIPTSLQYIPFSAELGAKVPIYADMINLQLGIGVLGACVTFWNHSPYVIQHQNKWGVGGVFNLKLSYNLPKNIFIDLFGKYTILKLPFHDSWDGKVVPQNVDLSGVSFGLGIGYNFGSTPFKSQMTTLD